MLATRGTIASSANQGANDPQPTDPASQSLDSLEMEEARSPEAIEPDPVNWQNLVERIHKGEESGMEELYRLFGRGIRYYLCRQLGHQELDDKVHDTFVIVVQAIRRGELRDRGFGGVVIQQTSHYLLPAWTPPATNACGCAISWSTPCLTLINQSGPRVCETVPANRRSR